MATLLLHVGTSKAGSTAIQDGLAGNRAALAAHGVAYYPALPGPNHTELAAAFGTRPSRVAAALGVSSGDDRARLQRALRRGLARSLRPGQTWLASSEHLASMLTRADDLDALRAFLAEFFDDVRVVVVLRRGDYWLPSAYVEYVKAGGTEPLDAAFVHRRRRTLDQQALLERWAQAFGTRAVRAVPYLESDKRDWQALPARLLAAMDLSEAADGWVRPARLRNESIGGYATEVLRMANPALRTSGLRPTTSRHRAIATVARLWPGPATALTPEAAAALDAAGWRDTGVAASPYAVGEGWDAWAAQPPADTTPAPRLDAVEQAAVRATLRERRLVRSVTRPAAGATRDRRTPVDQLLGWLRERRRRLTSAA